MFGFSRRRHTPTVDYDTPDTRSRRYGRTGLFHRRNPERRTAGLRVCTFCVQNQR